MNRRYLDDSLTGLRQVLIVLTQTTIASQPGKRPFHHPTTPQGNEPPLSRRTTYHPNPVGPMMHTQPTVQLLAVILVVGLHDFQAGEVFARQLSEQPLGCPSIVHVGGRDHHSQQQAQGVYDHMAFAAPDLFAAVGAYLLATACCLDRLAVHAGDARGPATVGGQTHPLPQGGKKVVPGAIAFPLFEVVVNGLPGWEVMGQSTPTTPLPRDVEDGVDDFPHIRFSGSATREGWRNPRFQDSPLGIRQIGRVSFAVHTSL